MDIVYLRECVMPGNGRYNIPINLLKQNEGGHAYVIR